jgi:hypothetical protein
LDTPHVGVEVLDGRIVERDERRNQFFVGAHVPLNAAAAQLRGASLRCVGVRRAGGNGRGIQAVKATRGA